MTGKTSLPPKPAEEDGLAAEDLGEEIVMLRRMMRQLATAGGPQADVQRQVQLLAALSQASTRLAQVLRVQAHLNGGGALAADLRRLADEVRKELEGNADEGA
jgi:hypothetical protein